MTKTTANWPNQSELQSGCRFLNPCKEMDYGAQIFEDATTHELIGTTPAAKWHIRICGLNAQHLIEERAKRTEHLNRLRYGPILLKGDLDEIADFANGYRELVETLIPEIPSPPKV